MNENEEYLDAFRAGDSATARALVARRASEAGFCVGPVFHGTDSEFFVFKYTEDIGFHFGPKKAAEMRIAQAEMTDGAKIVEAYLAISSPLRLPDLFTWSPASVRRALADVGIDIGDGEADRECICDALSAHGFDGIVYENATEGGGDSYIVFRPEAIRLADAFVVDGRGMPVGLDERFAPGCDIRGKNPYLPLL